MRRRHLLQTAAAALAAGLAGCGQGDGNGTPTDADGAAGTDGASPSPSPSTGDTQSGTTRADGTPSPDEETTTPGTLTDTPTPTDGATPAPTDSPTPTATPTESDVAQVVRVAADSDLTFAPESFAVATGETVRWVWEGGGHNVVPDSTPSGSDWEGTPGGSGDTYDEGYEYSHTFEVAGEYEYYCAPHRSLGMEGSFTITG